MIRLKATSTSYKTTIESIKTLVTSVMPSWSISTKTRSDLFKDLYSTTSEIEKFNAVADAYDLSYTSGFLFEPHVVFQYDFSDKIISDPEYDVLDFYSVEQAPSYYDFVNQHPTSFKILSELPNISTDPTLLYVSSYLETVNKDKFIVSTVGKTTIQTFYIDFNHTLISTFTRNYQPDIATYEYSSESGTHFLISTNYNTAFKISSGNANIAWLTSTNYSPLVDFDGDGFIDSTDISNYASAHDLEESDLQVFLNSVSVGGYYLYNVEGVCTISEVEFTFLNRVTNTYIDTNNGDSIIAQKLESGILLELDEHGFLYYGDININNEYGIHSKITGFDNFGDGMVFSSENKIYIFMFKDLVPTVVYEHEKNILSITYLSSDYIVLVDEDKKNYILKPEYKKVLIEDNILYSLEKINEDFLSRKLNTLLDDSTAHFGISRYAYESLYDYKMRCEKILGYSKERKFSEMLNIYYSNVFNEREVIFEDYIYSAISATPSVFYVTFDGKTLDLRKNKEFLYYNDEIVGKYNNKFIQLYRTIMNGTDLIISDKRYSFSIFIDSRLAVQFSTKIVYRPSAINTNGLIEDIPDENISTSTVLIDEYTRNIYNSNHTWGNISWATSCFDLLNEDTYAGSKYTSINSSGTNVKRDGIYDYKSFGFPEVKLVEHASEDDMSILVDEDSELNFFDKKTVQEMTMNGGSISSKLIINSGKFVDNENGNRLTKIISNFCAMPNNPVVSYYFPEADTQDIILTRVIRESYPEYVLENSLSSEETSDALYDNTGSIIKYIDYDLLASGKLYLNLFDPTVCPYNMKLSNTKANIFSNSELTPDPKSIVFSTNNEKKSYSGMDFPLFNDYYFGTYAPSVKYGWNTLEEKFDMYNSNDTLSSYKEFASFINSNGSRNPNILLLDKDVLLAETGLLETRVDNVMISGENINTWKNNTLSDTFKKNINISKYEIKYKNALSKSPTMSTIISQVRSELDKIINTRAVIIDVLLVSKEHFLWSGENNPLPYHSKDMFMDSIKKELNTYLNQNNLLLTTSTASLELSASGYFKKEHDYIALIITLNKPFIESI